LGFIDFTPLGESRMATGAKTGDACPASPATGQPPFPTADSQAEQFQLVMERMTITEICPAGALPAKAETSHARPPVAPFPQNGETGFRHGDNNGYSPEGCNSTGQVVAGLFAGGPPAVIAAKANANGASSNPPPMAEIKSK